ncbi:MAG: ribose-5-phosphate isomerase RpiA [Gammaproteobacteria bacterium]|nr:ribose-5-phosphate isomerase RpiA [Gammaproteobacteria bacterium]MDC0225882.1 ribose-5-phosphate isomerase RpiA [Gammaproteobacteria bacterium]MDC3240314.1 ribose-5-phosphate isomerase RpiA [Gammaproteobacteria bacterium]RZO95784.1 MAG: ribose-5-phosphate isomerase RpiA [Gammaproteobacteria bacterium]|tara:strand:+ start:191 stop:853 length:663 start_codon:yes stop_codon:yes gene_type:complete
MDSEEQKKQAALKSLEFINDDCILGVGTGSTVNHLIEALPSVKNKIEAVTSSSEASTKLLEENGFRVDDLSSVGSPDVYIDGADEITQHFHMIKGGGGALTREKIIAEASRKFVCIIDGSKLVDLLGKFPLPVEVIPMAKSLVARELTKLGGLPELRHDFVTDNGNLILDVHNLKILDPVDIESHINNIPGVVTNGIFAKRSANVMIIGNEQGPMIKIKN